MPHIHLETTANLQENSDIPDILEALVAELCRHGTISAASVKAYHTLRAVWTMGEGAPTGFVHCTVAILSGRPLELRKAIAAGMRGVLDRYYGAAVQAGDAGITLEVREMDRETYVK